MAAVADHVEIALSVFHKRVGGYIDDSLRQPVALTKHSRPYAYVVSPEFYAKAKEAMDAAHGHRRAITSKTATQEDLDAISSFMPSAREIETGEWDKK